MLIGAVVAGAGARTANVDLFSLVAGKGGLIAVLAVIFLFANLGSVCTHCLYNSAVGWSHVLNSDMRRAAVVLGAIGTLVAAVGVWSYFIGWLNFMSIIIPPIGGVLVADHFIVRRREKTDLARLPDFRIAPFITWAIAGLTALFINFYISWIPVVVWGMVVAVAVHPILVKFMASGILGQVRARSPVD
jgi:cytosine permease